MHALRVTMSLIGVDGAMVNSIELYDNWTQTCGNPSLKSRHQLIDIGLPDIDWRIQDKGRVINTGPLDPI